MLEYNGFYTPERLVRMRSPVRIWPAAPSSKQSPLCSGDFFMQKIVIRPLPCFSSPTQTHFVGLCVGIAAERILSRIRLFCVYFVLESCDRFSPTHPPTHGRVKVRKYCPGNGSVVCRFNIGFRLRRFQCL